MGVIALLCGGLIAGCASLGSDDMADASTDAYMAHMHRTAVGAGGLLPSRTFPFGTENYLSVSANARGNSLPPAQ